MWFLFLLKALNIKKCKILNSSESTQEPYGTLLPSLYEFPCFAENNYNDFGHEIENWLYEFSFLFSAKNEGYVNGYYGLAYVNHSRK